MVRKPLMFIVKKRNMKRIIKNLYTRKDGKAQGRLSELKTIFGLGSAAYVNTTSSGIDHGGLGGLTDDDHTQYVKHALATAASDFLVASGSATIVKKTLAETKVILGIKEYTAQETISGGVGGAISTSAFCSKLYADSNGDEFTLGAGSCTGHLKKLILVEDSSSGSGAVVTGTFAGTYNTLTFDTAGEYALLYWNGTAWLALELGSVLNLTDVPVLSTV